MDESESPFICKICYSSYDDDVKKPVIMNPCSHTVCKSCLSEILLLNKTCPFCKKEINGDISNSKPNYELVDIIYHLKTNNNNNIIKCGKCKEVLKVIYVEEKNSNINFICQKCAEKENIQSLESLMHKYENILQDYKNTLNNKINKDFIKNEICQLISNYLKKQICDLLEQKKDLFESFMDLPDFVKMLEKYRKSLEHTLNSKENSLKFLQTNNSSITSTIKDAMANNILNLTDLDSNEKLNQKIGSFEKTIEKEFNKNKLYLQSILQSLTNEIIYQSNIAVYNTYKESLKDDVSLLEKITMNYDILNNTSSFNSSNFQHNHIQLGSIYSQMQLQAQLNELEIADEISSYSNKLISDNTSVCVVGLIQENHPEKESLRITLEKSFSCECNLFIKDDMYFGCNLVFQTKKKMESFLEKKSYIITVGERKVKLFKKENKSGNRLYVKYL